MRGRDDDFLHDSCGSITTESDVNSDETPRPTRVFQYTFDNPSIFFLFLSSPPLPSLLFHTTDFLSSCAVYRLELQVTLYISFHKSQTCTSAGEEEEKRIFFRVDSIDGGSAAAALSFSRAMQASARRRRRRRRTYTYTRIYNHLVQAHMVTPKLFFSFSGRDLEELKISPPPLAASHFCWGGEVNNFAQRNVKKWETKSTKDEFTRGHCATPPAICDSHPV